MLRELERASRRAATDARRRERQAHKAHRAIEREMARTDRAQERGRARAEREAERQRLQGARVTKTGTKQAEKRAAKEAQLREWALELEAHQDRETAIERIANDGPEVEGRDEMFAALREPRVFEPEPFVAPSPVRSVAEARAVEAQADAELQAAVAGFRPRLTAYRATQIGGLALGAVGLTVATLAHGPAGAGFLLLGVAVAVIAGSVATRTAASQRADHYHQLRERLDARSREHLAVLERTDAERSATAESHARAQHSARVESTRREFEALEAERLRSLDELHAGDLDRMKSALEDAFDLDLPVSCAATFSVESSEAVSIELAVPDRDAIPPSEAKLLANGRVTYKPKTEKRIQEQYARVVSGLALRFASEAMLYLPSCHRVQVRAFSTALDRETGRADRRCLLEVTYDYATLAPMVMDAIDPVAALNRFPHRLSLAPGRDMRSADA
ncbi:MAG: hypothetical protein IT379_15025 [Deltaproteobacteria bacterium]|nr:hypothetical protein [Deltaproteobacteria bacterium]